MLVCSGKLQMSELGNRLGTSKPHTSSLIDNMVKEKLVDRKHDEDDGRIIHIMATKKGKAYLEKSKLRIKKDIMSNISKLNEKDKWVLGNSINDLRGELLKLNSGEK
jgi:DNA-binding MarR family transcriptional regulator